jgi:hypothetical protein
MEHGAKGMEQRVIKNRLSVIGYRSKKHGAWSKGHGAKGNQKSVISYQLSVIGEIRGRRLKW